MGVLNRSILGLVCLLALTAVCDARRNHRPTPTGPLRGAARFGPTRPSGRGALSGAQQSAPTTDPTPLEQCELRWRDATLDHFSWSATPIRTFKQRYYVCSEHFRKEDGPIFFYAGNEADVQLYLNNTGLMFENAEEFGALLVFAEHRYYGASKPFGNETKSNMGWLTTEQALADYADLLRELKSELKVPDAPVIAFGGSYGGMLASWFRIKYPHVIDGAIAASAPIWNFYGEDPPFDAGSFAAGVTYDASPAAGAAAECAPRVRAVWGELERLGATADGRAVLHSALRLCDSVFLNSTDDVEELRDWLGAAFDYMAMGNFPYASGYMLNGNGELPAFPMRVACSHMADAPDWPEGQLAGLAKAVGVFYNYSKALECYDPGFGPNPESDEDGNFWDYQWCTEMLMPASKDGINDMFWPEPFNETEAAANCNATWGVLPSKFKAQTEWGGRRIEAASNIVFSNGLLDPWHGGGVLTDVSDTVVAVIIPEGAHHLDLMFSRPDDPPSVTEARRKEMEHVRRWVDDANARRRPPTAAAEGLALGRRGVRGSSRGAGQQVAVSKR